MDTPAFQRNLYIAHRLEPETQARITEWDAGVRAAPRLPSTRWHHRGDDFLRAGSTTASTRIEGNQLSLWGVDQLLTGLRVEASTRDRREVTNYAGAMDLALRLASEDSFGWREAVLQQLNALVLRDLEHDTLGAYRGEPVTAGGGLFAAPDAVHVPRLMAALVAWLQQTDLHPLVRSALLHINLVAIHPWLDGNGRTTRIACLLDLDRAVRATELIRIEPALASDQAGYFRRIREATGTSWTPENHTTTAWVDWYVGLHLDALRDGRAMVEATQVDIVIILAALEGRDEPAEWGPIILTAAFGGFVASRIQRMYGNSASAARAMIGRIVGAGWLEAEGETRARVYYRTELIDGLGLGSPAAARRWARTGADDLGRGSIP